MYHIDMGFMTSYARASKNTQVWVCLCMTVCTHNLKDEIEEISMLCSAFD